MKTVRAISRSDGNSGFFGVEQLDEFVPKVAYDLSWLRSPLDSLADDDIGLDYAHDAPEPDFEALLCRNRLVELTATDAGPGKSALVHHIIANAIVPRSLHGADISGRDGIVILLDTDNTFDVSVLHERILAVFRQRLQLAGSNEALDDTEIEQIIANSMANVHIFRPQSFDALIHSLENLPTYLQGLSSQPTSQDKAIASIILDSASSFYWAVRADLQNRRINALDSESQQDAGLKDASTAPSLEHMIKLLKALSEQYECPVIATTWDMSSSSQTQGSSLNPAFPTAPAVRLEVYGRREAKFAHDVSAEEAREQTERRKEDSRSEEFVVSDGKTDKVFFLSQDTHGLNWS